MVMENEIRLGDIMDKLNTGWKTCNTFCISELN